jgi:membrane protease YdiL (CAAX protease family)
MTTTTALVIVLATLVLLNIWVHVGPRQVHVVTGPVAALVLLAVARAAGLSWAELGLARSHLLRGAVYGGLAAAAIAAVYVVGMAIPLTRRAFLDTRYQMAMRSAAFMSFVTIPLATVVFEEVAFRSVLWGLIASDRGATTATVVTSALFGLWHVLPALDATETNTAIDKGEGRRRRRVLLTVLGTVIFTAAAGVVFAELRRRSGSVVAPFVFHWATNGLAVVAAARVWISPTRPPRHPPSQQA